MPSTYRRAIAEIHYKIGLTFLIQQMNDEGASELEEACALIETEIEEVKRKEEFTEKDGNNIKDMEEIKQEIIAKVQEIKETKEQTKVDVRTALDTIMNPIPKANGNGGTSLCSSSGSNSIAAPKPKDITHLIKRKKPENLDDLTSSPAKKPFLEKS